MFTNFVILNQSQPGSPAWSSELWSRAWDVAVNESLKAMSRCKSTHCIICIINVKCHKNISCIYIYIYIHIFISCIYIYIHNTSYTFKSCIYIYTCDCTILQKDTKGICISQESRYHRHWGFDPKNPWRFTSHELHHNLGLIGHNIFLHLCSSDKEGHSKA